MLCSDDGVPHHHIQAFVNSLAPRRIVQHRFPGGERVKTRRWKEDLEDWAIEHGIGADAAVIAFGGGAVLDLVGFFAATYARGIVLLVVPSTLLSMADGAFGGKWAVNAHGMKNMIGTVYHPHAVLINPELLTSLPSRQIRAGLAEAAKHALLDSRGSVERLFASWDRCLRYDLSALETTIAGSLAVKRRFCSGSSHRRHLLNLGHTVAHALEALEGPELLHGEAVAIGMSVEAQLGRARGVVSQTVVEVAQEIVERVISRPVLKKSWNILEWKACLAHDKKNVNGQPHAVWMRDVGVPYVFEDRLTVGLESSEIDDAFDLVRTVTGMDE